MEIWRKKWKGDLISDRPVTYWRRLPCKPMPIRQELAEVFVETCQWSAEFIRSFKHGKHVAPWRPSPIATATVIFGGFMSALILYGFFCW